MNQSEHENNEIKILFKTPFEGQVVQDLELNIPKSWTIEKIKQKIQETHQLKPRKSYQRLIFAGRVLNNNQVVEDVLKDVRNNQSNK